MAKTRPGGARWIGIPARVLAMTFLSTLLSFAVALLLSIVGTVIYAQVKHVAPNLTFAYRHIAFPFAITVGSDGAGAVAGDGTSELSSELPAAEDAGRD